jgi:hypothetical protein
MPWTQSESEHITGIDPDSRWGVNTQMIQILDGHSVLAYEYCSTKEQ